MKNFVGIKFEHSLKSGSETLRPGNLRSGIWNLGPEIRDSETLGSRFGTWDPKAGDSGI